MGHPLPSVKPFEPDPNPPVTCPDIELVYFKNKFIQPSEDLCAEPGAYALCIGEWGFNLFVEITGCPVCNWGRYELGLAFCSYLGGEQYLYFEGYYYFAGCDYDY